ncbi:hypothetical protein [Rhodanobacter sp. BL-MT-08]
MSAVEKFIIYASRYRDESGGAIVLHKLCDTLNKIGHEAKVWPLWRPRLSSNMTLNSVPSALAYLGSRIYRGPFSTNKRYETPIAKASDVEGSIVVYPEIVSGNPLGADRYVRWLLHKPGFHEGKFKYSSGDLCFSYQDAFNNLGSDMHYGGMLTVAELFLDVYVLKNTGARTKTCHMIRKGKDRIDLPDLRNEWVVDGHSHQELAEIFNQCKICYFYDLYTMYAAYAAMCGCIPVVVPVDGVSKDQWVSEESNRVGLAYGVDDIPYAVDTRGRLLENVRAVNNGNLESVQRFVSIVSSHFDE